MTTWEALQRTPIAEVRRRAAIVDRWNDIEQVDVPGGVRFAWNDGGGQAAGWFFADDGRALLLTYEHESALNFYEDYTEQAALFGGVPPELVALVANRGPRATSSSIRTTGRAGPCRTPAASSGSTVPRGTSPRAWWTIARRTRSPSSRPRDSATTWASSTP